MPSSKLKTLALLNVLRRLTDAEHRMSVPELTAALDEAGVSAERKGVYRDIEALIEHGADIVKTSTGYYLGKRELELGELRLLISAVQAAYFITPERSEALMGKLASFASVYDAQALIEGANMGGVKSDNDEVLGTIEVLNMAIAGRRHVSFSYYKHDPRRKSVPQRSGRRYRVSPYAMIWMQDRYYLVCNMDERDDLTHFRLDRMQSVRTDDAVPWRHFMEVSPYRGKFDTADYARKSVNMFGGKPRMVTLRCLGAVADDIFDRFGKEVLVNPDPLDPERFLAHVNVSTEQGFLSWVAQYADSMEIVSPEDVRLAMHERLLRTAGLYADRD